MSDEEKQEEKPAMISQPLQTGFSTKEFDEAAKPLIKFLNHVEFHPHMTVVVTATNAELMEGKRNFVTHEFVKD